MRFCLFLRPTIPHRVERKTGNKFERCLSRSKLWHYIFKCRRVLVTPAAGDFQITVFFLHLACCVGNPEGVVTLSRFWTSESFASALKRYSRLKICVNGWAGEKFFFWFVNLIKQFGRNVPRLFSPLSASEREVFVNIRCVVVPLAGRGRVAFRFDVVI